MYLSPRLLWKNTMDWVAYKQQEFISYSSGGWGVQDQSSRICVSRELFFLFIDGPADGCCVLPGQNGRELCGACFIRVLVLFLRSLLSWPYHLLRTLCSGLGVNIGTLWGEHKHSACDTWSLVSSAGIHGCTCMHGCVQLFATLWTVARQVPLSLEFSRQEYWSGFLLPTPGSFPHLLSLLHWQADSLPLCHLGSLTLW